VLYAAYKLRIAKPELPGYDRGEFGQAWADVDGNGCDQRNDVLRRDTVKRHTKPDTNGCVLQSGALDPNDEESYGKDGAKFRRGSGKIEIDHVVSLADAWRMGAYDWSTKRRQKFANDLMNLQAVDARTNRDKEDSTAEDWLPENQLERCAFVVRQVAIKKRYRLSVTHSERAVFIDELSNGYCNGIEKSLPKSKSFKAPKPKPIGEPKPEPAREPEPRPTQRPKSPQPSIRRGVHPGAFCSPAGELGVTVKSTPMVCKGPGQPRWRAR
jgi:hypothetical protein